MNYKRVYDQFIADRRAREAGLAGYTETHHIIPRCMGGQDDAGNLIRLTPEDHYFAHLLLAKIHGGKMWAAVHAMKHLVNSYQQRQAVDRLTARPMFGVVRRKLAQHQSEVFSGPDSPQADRTVYELRHRDGRVARGSRFSLAEQTGIPRQRISTLVLGTKKNVFGWYSPIHNPDGKSKSELLSDAKSSDEILDLHHHDGSRWQGTRKDFAAAFGHRFHIQNQGGHAYGWYLRASEAARHGERVLRKAKNAADARGNIGGAANPNADATVYRWEIVATGELISCTKIDLKRRFGIKSAAICSLFSGRQKQTGGIALVN